MRRASLSTLSGKDFDVVVVGGGINGASATQALAADGFDVLMVETRDFGAGASSKSARMMHFGLRYLDRGEPLLNYLKNPAWFWKQCRRARDTMQHRAQLVRDMPERVLPYTMYLPVYREDFVAPWQIDAGLKLINAISKTDVPAEWRRLEPAEYRKLPFVRDCRDHERLQAVFAITEHRYDWPERITADYVLDAARMGATCRNYTSLAHFERAENGRIRLLLEDTREPGVQAEVTAARMVNAAGAWIDQVLHSSGLTKTTQIAGTKGVHAAVRLPAEYRDQGFAHFTRDSYPFYALPWRDLHYIGPTETHFSGDPATAKTDERDLDWLIEEANRMMPGLRLTRDSILYHWVGVRPMPHIPGYRGKQNLVPEFHTHDAEGFPDILSVPGGPLMLHRFTGQRMAKIASNNLDQRGSRTQPSYKTRRLRENTNSAPVLSACPEIRFEHLKDIAREELVVSLSDVLLRRTGLVWTGALTPSVVRSAALSIAEELNWAEDEIETQVSECLRDLKSQIHTTTEDTQNEPHAAE